MLAKPFPISQPLAVSYRFVFRDPAVFGEGTNRAIYRTDIDNMLKFINDALTGVVWQDDSQIFDMRAVKTVGPVEGIELHVWKLS